MVEKSTKKWFLMPAGQWCGVFLEEKAAEQLQEILSRHAKEVTDFLTAHKDALLPYHWTLAYPNGKQEVVHYSTAVISEYELDNRIELFEHSCELKCADAVYLSDSKSCVDAETEIVKFYTKLREADDSILQEVE